MFKYLSIALAGVATLAVGAFLLVGWPGAAKPPRAAVAPAPPEVGVIVTQAAETPLPFEYSGRVAGFRNVEVRPRVGGLLLTREYVEGAKVREGDVLFRIDPATYEVALSRAEAQRQQAQATLRQAEENFTFRPEVVDHHPDHRDGSKGIELRHVPRGSRDWAVHQWTTVDSGPEGAASTRVIIASSAA